MPSTPWSTQEITTAPQVTAPDGATVRILCATARGSAASFSLEAGAVSKPVAHRTVEEIWFVVAGQGRMWRKLGDDEAIVDLVPGLSLTIPAGTGFQFRNDGGIPLQIAAVTIPPWPGDGEALVVNGTWAATV